MAERPESGDRRDGRGGIQASDVARRVVVLGSTGTIGRAAIEIIENAGGAFKVVGLAGGSNAPEMARQLRLCPEALFSMKDGQAVDGVVAIDGALERRAIGHGDEGLRRLVEDLDPEIVVNALVGIAGLLPTVSALERGCTVALANKESLVTAGELISRMLAGGVGRIIPVDSEHFSVSRCIRGYEDRVEEIVLTASGGPFFRREDRDLSRVSIADVLDHPTWHMGRRITVDSASMLNKGLEVIEAHHLFGFALERIKVVVHPQSIVHALVRLTDGSLIAHLGPPDMRLPIMSALYYPEMKTFRWDTLDLESMERLEFHPLDRARYPAFELALGAASTGGTAPAVLNAADEMAVEAFLSGRIGFLTIVDWIEEALAAHTREDLKGVATVLAADGWTRRFLVARHREAAPI